MVAVEQEKIDEGIPFASSTVNDATLDAGTTAIETAGQNGVLTRTYAVTRTDGIETERKLISEVVTVEPVNEVIRQGTKQPAPAPAAPPPVVAPQVSGDCDPNYAGACVPIASDVDCEGGSGDGPSYVRGPVQVIGKDIYKLDRDSDGVACDN